MARQFEMTQNAVLTLYTAGKTCTEDIKVNVAVPGEDVATETETYTEKLSVLETAITELENELDGKINGENVTTETEVYTDKLATLETAITELEIELQDKTSSYEDLDIELATQDDLIAQIQTALEGKASGTTVIEPELQEKTVSPTTSLQTITPDSDYDGLSKVTVNAMPTATQATPSITVSSSGLITASATQSAGYVAAGTKSGTKQLTTQAAKTITPTTSSQTAVNSGVYTTGAVTVGAIPSTYVKPTTTKSATTYTPTTSNQTITAGTYCSGAQTIEGDANLVADNIKSGVSIFGVNGSYEGSGGSSGGDLEVCTLTIFGDAPPGLGSVFYYIDGSSNFKTVDLPEFGDSVSINVLKNSIVVSTGGGIAGANATKLTSGSLASFFISGNASIIIG